MHIEEIIQQIVPLDAACASQAQARFDALIKPVGSLAKLEEMTSKYAGIVGTADKHKLNYPKRAILVWCSVEETNEATKILQGKYPVNVLAAETNAEAIPIVVTSISDEEALLEGATKLQEFLAKNSLGAVGFGCLSPTTNGLVLSAMCGGMLLAAARKIPIMLDGLATCLAAKKAISMCADVVDYCFAGHLSSEAGAEDALNSLKLKAPLRLDIPDGSGEGAAICFTLFDAGIKAFKEMETFAEAGVHVETKEFSWAEQTKKGK